MRGPRQLGGDEQQDDDDEHQTQRARAAHEDCVHGASSSSWSAVELRTSHPSSSSRRLGRFRPLVLSSPHTGRYRTPITPPALAPPCSAPGGQYLASDTTSKSPHSSASILAIAAPSSLQYS